ncbi:stealth family protein [Streptomyces beihaiensis]|uniref:Stealth conserved region 3 domain-containing protein n=1 Tax=Streptomyces beihaiensis TaxID=2984495 RepID=A0ABT3TR01_9ACTN|nr:stealth conserved region 3 domain-containing protein [Streptomyces beihaiensis]MCX3059190.1 stealth conserved region 3 domain-containing protein [Streptomyces beihaiensis]
MHNPEAPQLVATYRRILPVGARRAIAQRVDPELRRQVKVKIAAAADTTETWKKTRFARRFGPLVAHPDRRVVYVAHSARIAHVQEDPTPLSARRANLEDVMSALRGAGIAHFCVRTASHTAAAVAVEESDRARALAALGRLCRIKPGYVSAAGRGAADVPDGALAPGYQAASWPRFGAADAIRCTWYRTDAAGALVLGARYGCDIEFWRRQGGELVSPRGGVITESVPADEAPVQADESLFTDLAPLEPRPGYEPVRVPTRPFFTARTTQRPDFPIDAVYTWVDGNDEKWARRRAEHADVPYHAESANDARFLSRDELRYSLRSLHLYAPWIRNIYIVTDDQTPSWLDTDHPKIKLVSHRDIFRPADVLPVFNSHAIESQLHHIEGLSEHFLYLNDDVMFGREVVPQDFFLRNGLSKFFPSPALVPLGDRDPSDPPVAAAGKNNRRLIEERFGATLVQKMKHMPHALHRAVLAEIEDEFPEEHRRTAASRFRSPDDISVTSSLHHYYAFHTSRAFPARGGLRYMYCDISQDGAERKLGTLLKQRSHHVLCVNDTVSDASDMTRLGDLLDTFLGRYFPSPSPFERDA